MAHLGHWHTCDLAAAWARATSAQLAPSLARGGALSCRTGARSAKPSAHLTHLRTHQGGPRRRTTKLQAAFLVAQQVVRHMPRALPASSSHLTSVVRARGHLASSCGCGYASGAARVAAAAARSEMTAGANDGSEVRARGGESTWHVAHHLLGNEESGLELRGAPPGPPLVGTQVCEVGAGLGRARAGTTRKGTATRQRRRKLRRRGTCPGRCQVAGVPVPQVCHESRAQPGRI